MSKFFQIGVLMIMAAVLLPADQDALRPENGSGVPKAQPKSVPLRNPASPAARLYRATPEQRERALEKLPVPMQQRIRKELAWFDSLPREQQEIALKRTERLAALPPGQQRAVRQQLQALNRLEPERRRAVRSALNRLQNVSGDQRKAILARPQFRARFSPEEWQMIMDLSAVMIPE